MIVSCHRSSNAESVRSSSHSSHRDDPDDVPAHQVIGQGGHEPVERLKERFGLSQFVGESPALLAALRLIPRIAARGAKVLIRGESGTGKEICARSIHQLSRRRDGPFVAVNCGSLSPSLIQNELFGHVPGAFTSANGPAGGFIGSADGGTALLDEIALLPEEAQGSLLRFVQTGEFCQVGSGKVRTANVRVIAATNADLLAMVRAHTFREDLYYRLAVMFLADPALNRKRPTL